MHGTNVSRSRLANDLMLFFSFPFFVLPVSLKLCPCYILVASGPEVNVDEDSIASESSHVYMDCNRGIVHLGSDRSYSHRSCCLLRIDGSNMPI